MTDEINPRDEEKQALDRLARTYDGVLLHRYLRRILEDVRVTDDPGALQRHAGARTLARDLMGHMAAGIESNRGRSGADDAVLGSGVKPVDTGGGKQRGTVRRVQLEPGDGWSPEPTASQPAGRRRRSRTT